MQDDPRDAVLAWFDAQPPEVQKTVAMFVCMRLPGFEPTLDPEAFAEWLRKWIQDDENGRRLAIAGKLIIFRALVDFSCRRHFTKEGWNDMAELHEWVLDHADEEIPEDLAEDIAKTSKRILQQRSLREAIWLRASDQWEKLCDAYLSDEYLSDYQYDRLLDETDEP